MFQHDLQHTGRTSLVGPAGTDVLWSFALERDPGFPVTGADGTIYLPTGTVQDGDGFLYAINPNGTQQWRLTLPGGPASSAPAIGPDGTIYLHLHGSEGNVAASDRVWAVNPNGTQKWENNLGTAFTGTVISSPAVASDGSVWVGSKNTVLYRLSPTDGSVICGVSPSVSSISSSPAIAPDGTVYVIDASTHLFAVAPNCDVTWEFQLSDEGIAGANDQSPAIAADGTVWAPSIDDHVYAVNPNGTLKCRFASGETEVRSAPAIAADGTVYVSADGLYALNPANCTQKWRFAPFGSLFSSASPIVDGNGNIYARAGFDDLYSVTPAGAQRWSLDANPTRNGADPTAVISEDGVLYLADGGLFDHPKRLRAIGGGGTGNGPSPSPSPDPTESPSPSPDPTESPSPEPKEVVLKASRNRVPRGRRVRLIATVSPCAGHEGHFVRFQKRTFFGWKSFARRDTNDLCRARVRVRLWRRTIFRAVSPRQDEDHLAGRSNRVRVRVRR